MEEIKQRISQTEPNSSINLQQIDTALTDCFYTALGELKKENQISEEHKKKAKVLLIQNDRELLQLLFNSKNNLQIMKENVIKLIKSHFLIPPKAMKENSISSNSSLLEVQISRNSTKSPQNVSSQNKPEIGSFLKYLEELITNSPNKLNQYDKKQLQKIFKKLQQVVFDQCSPLAPQRKSLNSSNHNLLSAGNLSPLKNQFSSEDILSLYNIYKLVKSVYKELLRLAQLFVQDNLDKQQTLYNVNKLLKVLINVDSFCFISNPNTGSSSVTQAQPLQQKKAKSEDDKVSNGGALQSIRVSESILQDNKPQKDQEWIFFDSESNQQNQNGYSFQSDTLSDEISQLHQGLIELKDLDPNTYPTIIAKCSSYNPQYKAYVYKFYNYKSGSYEVISFRYESEVSFFNEKSKIVTNNLALPIYQNQAFPYLGQFVVNTTQNLNSQSECLFQIIDLSNMFLNLGKNLLIDSFQQKLKSTFKINTHIKQIDTKESKSQDAEERTSLFKNSQLVLEDDYSDIVFQSTNGENILNDPAVYTFFIEISHYFAKYKQFLLKMSQKAFVYKYFLRNQYQTFLDISKKGELKFISHQKSNLDIDYNDIQERSLKIEDIFKNNKAFIKEFYEIIEYFKQPLEEQEKINLKHHKEEENEKQKIQKNENILPNVLQMQDDDIQLNQQNRSSIQHDIKVEQNSQNSYLSPDFGEKFYNQNLNGNGESKSNNNNNSNNANNNNKSFVSSASKSYRPYKSFIKKPNTWFNLKSINDSQIYVQITTQKQKIIIQSIFINIQDDFHSDSCTNFESFYQLDDILNSLNNSEFNDPRIKLILKKLYSKINSISIEEKVSIENQNTQIEMFTQNHRERFTSTPAIGASQKGSVIIKQTAKLNQSKQLSNNSPTALQKQQLSQSYLKSLLHASPAVTNIDDWDFNIFELKGVEEKYTTAWNILKRAQYFESCSIPEDVFANFVKELQKQYDIKNNDFHNFDHGVSVMQSCYMLSKCIRATQILKPIDIFTVILSGLCHDVGHTGRTNNFEISVQSKLAIRYHDKSVLEQHHLATTFKIMKQSLDYNILQNLEPAIYNQVRRSMISNILYTDIKQHFKLILDFETYWKNYDDQSKTTTNIPEAEIDLLTGMIIHTADFTGAAKPFQLSRQWSEKVNREFHNQYIEEGKRGVEQTSFMKDLDVLHVMAKAEKGFLNVIVLPLWQSLNDFYKGELKTQIQYLTDSINQWGELSQQVPQQAPQPQQIIQNNDDKADEASEDIKQIESSSDSDEDGDEENNKLQQQQIENIKNASDYEEDKNSNEIIFEMDNEESNEKLNTINIEDSENQQPLDSSPHQ
ncbi:hypothetical protein ABPG72_010715 [Tetrahymena utriculariae]